MKICLNGLVMTPNGFDLDPETETFSYSDVVRMAGEPAGSALVVTFRGRSRSGTLRDGESLVAEDGMVINAVRANKKNRS